MAKSPDINKIFGCGCCKEPFPSLYKHVHHKTPKALGGKDTPDNLIELCPGCHDALHNIAWRMLQPHQQSKIMDSLHLIYKENTRAKEICLDLASRVRNSMIKNREVGMGPNHLINIGTTLRKTHKVYVEMRTKELRTSQEKYIRSLILADISKRFNIPISNIEEDRMIKAIKDGKKQI